MQTPEPAASPDPQGDALRSLDDQGKAPQGLDDQGETPQSLARNRAARLSRALQGIDLTSADGRAGISALLAEIERLSPGAILKQAASLRPRNQPSPSS